MKVSIPYFAYGSNMDVDQMRLRCPGAKILGFAVLEKYRFLINSRGVATVIPDDPSLVRGVLWNITEKHEAALDRYEGIGEGWYSKETVEIRTPRGDLKRTMVYIGIDREPGAPRKGYLEKIIGAASLHVFPPEYLKELESWLR